MTMERVNVVDRHLDYDRNSLIERPYTDMIVVHNTGNPTDDDVDAVWVNSVHQNANDWIAIGYNYLIRKNGIVEEGRPHWAMGAHAQGYNKHTIGICLSGNFMIGDPTTAQIESLAMLLANLCADYNIPIDRKHIIGHREVNDTDCPGDNLYNMLDDIVGKANFYRYPPEQEVAASLDRMTPSQLAYEVAMGLINTGIEGVYSSVECSSAGDYPSIGVSQWEGDRADALLDRIPGGIRYVDHPFSRLVSQAMIEELEKLLDSPEGRKAQVDYLAEDCMHYVDYLSAVRTLDDPRCIIYACMWCPTSHYVVKRFLTNRENRVNLRSLKALRDLFYNEYAKAASVSYRYYAGYQNRAEKTYQYVAAIDLTTPYGVSVYGESPNGR